MERQQLKRKYRGIALKVTPKPAAKAKKRTPKAKKQAMPALPPGEDIRKGNVGDTE